MVGLGKMGGNMAERLRRAGHEVVGYDRDPTGQRRGRPRRAGRGAGRLAPGGLGHGAVGRAHRRRHQDAGRAAGSGRRGGRRRQLELARLARPTPPSWPTKGIGFVDVGVSGGVWGLEEGYCLMVGGEPDHVAVVQPAFDALAPAEGGFAHVGPTGAGHFTKMVHNGIEYGLMQAYAEGYELLSAADLDIDVDAALRSWRTGSVVRSWLLDLLVRALDDDPGLAEIKGCAADSGEGRWTVDEAVRLAVPAAGHLRRAVRPLRLPPGRLHRP